MNIKYTDTKCYTQTQLQQLFQSVNWISANYPERLLKAMNNSETVFTAWSEGELVALINAIDDGELTAYVHYLCVNPAFQGNGIGKTLLRKVQEKYRDYLYLILIAENEKLIDFYENNGFEHVKGTYLMSVKRE